MNKQGFISAFVTFLIVLGGSLITLWTASSVESFSDVSEVAYASAFITALVSAAQGYKARMSRSPNDDGKIL